ncbi:MAG: hypothetical protein M3R06_03135 [Chloroflexota bacterium]|nr:hypothetical protein [Chloroflexota bacterium]
MGQRGERDDPPDQSVPGESGANRSPGHNLDPEQSPRNGDEGPYPIDAMRERLRPMLGNRPLSVYGVLAAGIAVLLVLLAIIWITATDNDAPEPPVCVNLDGVNAQEEILAGRVDRATILFDPNVDSPDSARFGPAAVRLNMLDGSCFNLPQGLLGRDVAYQIVGIIDFYNTTTDNQRVQLRYEERGDLPAELFHTPTVPATEAPASPTAASPTASPPPASPTAASPTARVIASPTARPPTRTPTTFVPNATQSPP